MNTHSLLALDNVSYRIGSRGLVDGLHLKVARGDVVGLLGVNGAGKTTTLRMISGVLKPSSGTVLIDGEDLAEQPTLARSRIGYLPERPPLHDELTVDEYLRYCARLHGVERGEVEASVYDAVEACDLGEVRRRLIAGLSQGFRQRVGIAQAIVHRPSLIVLDEPATGLDPVQAMALRHLIGRLGQSCAVILSTHLLTDVTACCQRVAILHQGHLRHVGRLDALASRDVQRIVVGRDDLAMVDWLALPGVISAEPVDQHHWRVQTVPNADLAALAAAVVARDWRMSEMRPDHPALDAIFLQIALGNAEADAA